MRKRENFMKRQIENEIECKDEAAARQLISETNVSNAILSFPDEAHNREKNDCRKSEENSKEKLFSAERHFFKATSRRQFALTQRYLFGWNHQKQQGRKHQKLISQGAALINGRNVCIHQDTGRRHHHWKLRFYTSSSKNVTSGERVNTHIDTYTGHVKEK